MKITILSAGLATKAGKKALTITKDVDIFEGVVRTVEMNKAP